MEIADTVKLSKCSVYTILQENLGMKKLFFKWVPLLLTLDPKEQRVDDLERCSGLFKRIKKDFLMRYVTIDETRPETFWPSVF